jgi:transcriptional regulator with XRE-family HTH domain
MRKNLAVRHRIGRRVRQLRRSRGFTQEGLAELVGNTWKHIGQIERGQVNVGIDTLAGIAQALEVDIAELFAPSTPSKASKDLLTERDLLVEHALDLIQQSRDLLQQSRRIRE